MTQDDMEKNADRDMSRGHKLQEIALRDSELQKSLAALRQELSDICSYRQDKDLPAELTQALTGVHEAWQEAQAEIREKLEKVEQMVEVGQLGQKYLARLEASKDKVADALRKVQEDAQEKYAAWEIKMMAWQEQLQILYERATAAKPFAGPADMPTESLSGPAVLHVEGGTGNRRADIPARDVAIVLSIERAYMALLAARPGSDKVDFPALYEKVKEEFPGLSIPRYKEILLKLCQMHVIDLQPVAEHGLKQLEFGIPTAAGDLFYVVWR